MSPYRIAKGTKRETLAKEGSIVIAGTMSAMFDRNVVDSPNEFHAGRPKETQIFFGHALHTCFGEHIARVMVPVVIESLLRAKGLRRAAGSKGRLRYDGPFPDRLVVEFEPSHAHLVQQDGDFEMPTDYPIMMACEIARFTFVRDYVVKQLGAFEFVDPKKVLEESDYYKGTKPI